MGWWGNTILFMRSTSLKKGTFSGSVSRMCFPWVSTLPRRIASSLSLDASRSKCHARSFFPQRGSRRSTSEVPCAALLKAQSKERESLKLFKCHRRRRCRRFARRAFKSPRHDVILWQPSMPFLTDLVATWPVLHLHLLALGCHSIHPRKHSPNN